MPAIKTIKMSYGNEALTAEISFALEMGQKYYR